MKIIALICATLLVLMIVQPIIVNNVGITPDSPLYIIKRIFENLDIMLTFNDVSKAEKYLKYAKMRLMEAVVMARKGKYEYINGLMRDYLADLYGAVELVKLTNPSDSERIAGMIVNKTAVYLDILNYLSKIVPDNSSVRLAEINTVRFAEMAVRNAQSGKTLLELSLTRILLGVASERIKSGEKAGYLIRESDKIFRSVNIKKAPVYIVEQVKRIIDEATNITIVQRNRNLTQSIIQRGIEIYRRLGIGPVMN